MHCILCYNNLILNLNPKTQARRRLIIDSTTNGIITFIKHVNLDHLIYFFEEVNSPLRKDEIKPLKNRLNMFSNSMYNFFCYKRTLKKIWFVEKAKSGGLGFLIVKSHFLL